MPAFLSGGFPCQQPPKGVKGAFIYENDDKAKNSVKSSLPAILGGGFPLPATPNWLEKGHSFNGMTRWIKTVIDGGILVLETVLQVNCKSTCVVMARDRLVKMCSSRGEQIPLVHDKGIITHLSSLDLTRPSGRVGRSS